MPKRIQGRIDLIIHGARGGEENMALDREALARAESGEASLRIYGWKRPTVTLGKSQKAEDVADLFSNLPTVSRPSGGGAVLHGFDVTVALAMPLEMLGVGPRALKETYVRMVKPLARALIKCDLPCSLAEERAIGSEPDCFASSGRMDLLQSKTGRKVAGCALAATRSAALLHASIPASDLPTWLPISDETARHYTNPIWNARLFAQAFPAVLREEFSSSVDLQELDRELPARERAALLLWHEVDVIGVNDQVGAVGEYDSYAPDFAGVQNRKELRRAIGALQENIGLRVRYDEERLFKGLQGFTR